MFFPHFQDRLFFYLCSTLISSVSLPPVSMLKKCLEIKRGFKLLVIVYPLLALDLPVFQRDILPVRSSSTSAPFPPCSSMFYLCSIWKSFLSLSVLPICAPPPHRHCLTLFFFVPSFLYVSVLLVINTDIPPVCLCSSCVLNWHPSCLSRCFIPVLHVFHLFTSFAFSALQLKGRWEESNKNVWFRFMYSQKWNCAALLFIMFCLPISPFMYLWATFIFPGLFCIICYSQIGRPILGIHI